MSSSFVFTLSSLLSYDELIPRVLFYWANFSHTKVFLIEIIVSLLMPFYILRIKILSQLTLSVKNITELIFCLISTVRLWYVSLFISCPCYTVLYSISRGPGWLVSSFMGSNELAWALTSTLLTLPTSSTPFTPE